MNPRHRVCVAERRREREGRMRVTTGIAAILGAILGALLGAIILVAPAAAQAQPLRTAVDGTFAPHAFPDMQGGVQGFNVDLAKEIGRKLQSAATGDPAPR